MLALFLNKSIIIIIIIIIIINEFNALALALHYVVLVERACS